MQTTIIRCDDREINVEIPDELSNLWGSVRVEDGLVRLYVAYPESVATQFMARGLTLRNPIAPSMTKEGHLRVCKGGLLRLADKPELAALVARGREMAQALQVARQALWEQMWEQKRQSDRQLIAHADVDADAYRRTIPPDHVILITSHDQGAADGWGVTTYTYQGQTIPWSLPGLVTKMFSAVRPGAMGAFYTAVVAHAPLSEITQCLSAQEAAHPKPAVPSAPGPGYCSSCETYCYGDCGHYAPVYGPGQLRRDTQEAARETNYGISD